MVLIVCVLALLGATMGSFVGALVWRLRTNRDFVKGRSECEHCHHVLGVTDLLPVVSWLRLGGRCRYCKKPIGWTALLLELGLAGLFAASYLLWPTELSGWLGVASFGIWLIYLVLLAALLVYDLRWLILPDKLVFVLIGLGLIDAALRLTLVPGDNYFMHIILGVLPVSGLYALLYFVSKGKWVGFGDVKLGLFIGIVLGWQKALLVLLLANVIGFILVVPGLFMGKLNRKSRVPFGPFLIVAFVIAGLLGDAIISWYVGDLILSAMR